MEKVENGVSPIDRWIRRFSRLVLVALMGVACFFLWRISMTAYQVEKMIADNQEDMTQIVGTAAAISEKIDRLSKRLDELEQAARDNLPIEEVEDLFGEMGDVMDQFRAPRADRGIAVENEIRFLLDQVRDSPYHFGYAGKDFSSRRMAFLLRSKYRMLGKGLDSAEDFILELGMKTINGEAYYIILDEDERKPLDEWLTESLRFHREKRAKDGP